MLNIIRGFHVQRKICTRCKIDKSYEDFYLDPSRKSGLKPECKDCLAKRAKDNWIINKDILTPIRKEQSEIRKATGGLRPKISVQTKLARRLRTRTAMAIRQNNKGGSAVADLGCSIDEFKVWLESQFVEHMSWDNWGKGPGYWNIDHKIPLSSADLSDFNEFQKVAHFTNLQPLWFEDNMAKFNRLDFYRPS
jgi:hypothetical protein